MGTKRELLLGGQQSLREDLPLLKINRENGDYWPNTYILGGSRSGKTTFSAFLASHQIKMGGLVVIDPHGELAIPVASLCPKDRLIYADKNNPLIINCLRRRTLNKAEKVKELVSAINSSIKAINPSQQNITPKMLNIFKEAIYVMDDEHSDVHFLVNFLFNPVVRKKYWENHHKPDYWRDFDSPIGSQLRASASYIYDRLKAVFEDETIEKWTSGEDEFDLHKIAREGKIVVFNLDGIVSEDLYYLGNLISHSIKSYMAQAEVGAPPVGIFVDEFYLFLNQTWRNSLVGCLKRGINFTMIHQNHSQLRNELLDIILTNCDLKVCLRVNSQDATRMASEFNLNKSALLEMEKYHSYVNIFGASTYIANWPPPKNLNTFTPPKKFRQVVNFLREDIIQT